MDGGGVDVCGWAGAVGSGTSGSGDEALRVQGRRGCHCKQCEWSIISLTQTSVFLFLPPFSLSNICALFLLPFSIVVFVFVFSLYFPIFSHIVYFALLSPDPLFGDFFFRFQTFFLPTYSYDVVSLHYLPSPALLFGNSKPGSHGRAPDRKSVV